MVVSRPCWEQVDAERVKLGQERHKVFQTAAQAIDIPGQSQVAKVYKDHGISGAKGRNGRPARKAEGPMTDCRVGRPWLWLVFDLDQCSFLFMSALGQLWGWRPEGRS